jgi:hypothetical protein
LLDDDASAISMAGAFFLSRAGKNFHSASHGYRINDAANEACDLSSPTSIIRACRNIRNFDFVIDIKKS